MPKLMYNRGSMQYIITVPLTLVKFKQWQAGDEFEFIEDGRDIIFRRVDTGQR